MRNRIISVAFLAAPILGGEAVAQEVEAGDLAIADAYVLETAPGARSGAGYLTITNEGESADRLVEVRGDFPRVDVHATEMENDVARMVPVASLEIEPGQTVTMEPGGMHVMFMGIEAPFAAGETVSATLVFETAGEVEVSFPVRTREEAGGMAHGGGAGH